MSKAHLKGQTNILIKPMNSSYLSINVLHTTEWIDLFGLIKVIDPATFYRTNFLRESATATFIQPWINTNLFSICTSSCYAFSQKQKNVELQTCR